MNKGQFVIYSAWNGCGPRIQAIVCSAHRDGTSTVEARHVLNENGEPTGAYLGYRYRIPNERLVVQP